MAQADAIENLQVDLSSCEREPIHIPGSIQPHGTLVVLRAEDGEIIQAAENVQRYLGLPAHTQVLHRKLDDLLGADHGAAIVAALRAIHLERTSTYIRLVPVGSAAFHAIGHRSDGMLIVEFERSDLGAPISFDRLHSLVRTFMAQMEGATSLFGMSQLAAIEVRRITQFDRVLIYRFDEAWNGSVVAEDRNDRLPSYLGLRFPASDIPAQARELYRLNRLRQIPDANYTPVPLVPAVNPETGRSLDLSQSILRSVSPIHVEYMKNMETGASTSISIIKEGRLWGLISCHHHAPMIVPFEVRAACEFLGQVLSMQLTSQDRQATLSYRASLKSQQTRILSLLAQADNFAAGLYEHSRELMTTLSATGLAVVSEGEVALEGMTCSKDEVLEVVEWLRANGDHEVYVTDTLSEQFTPAANYADRVSGLLAINVSQVRGTYILWMRSEELQTVKWAGDPRKAVSESSEGLRLHPRRSFEIWKETVRGKSLPWLPAEVEAATELRAAITTILLKKAEELAGANEELRRSNRELEAFSYSVSHDLRAPFRHIVGYAELVRDQTRDQLDGNVQRYLDTIIDSAHFAGTLVDNLLHFSQVGRATLRMATVDMNLVTKEALHEALDNTSDRNIDWKIADLPPVVGDAIMLRLVMSNLISNALKFTKSREQPCIEIGVSKSRNEWIFFVRDNGVGFDMAYKDKLFGVFQRLHRMEDFEGTGIGLANVRRIIERHRGRVWAEGAVDQGATFYFALPETA